MFIIIAGWALIAGLAIGYTVGVAVHELRHLIGKTGA